MIKHFWDKIIRKKYNCFYSQIVLRCGHVSIHGIFLQKQGRKEFGDFTLNINEQVPTCLFERKIKLDDGSVVLFQRHGGRRQWHTIDFTKLVYLLPDCICWRAECHPFCIHYTLLTSSCWLALVLGDGLCNQPELSNLHNILRQGYIMLLWIFLWVLEK